MINSLLKFAEQNGVIVCKDTYFSKYMPGFADTKSKAIVINMNWYDQRQIPFMIAHEITHVLSCDNDAAVLAFSTLMTTKYEFEANTGAIKLLLPYYIDTLDEISQININNFMNMFSIPMNMYDACFKAIKEYVNHN